MPTYSFHLDRIRIDEIRSVFNDTDFATLSIQVGDKVYGPVTKSLGKLKKGIHDVGLSIDSIDIQDDATDVTVAFEILNSGHESTDKIQQKAKDSVVKILNKVPTGQWWSELGGWIFNELAEIFVANCDGVVAADRISLKGADIYRQTRDGRQIFGNFYSGLESPLLCGDNSKYYVTWSIQRPVKPDRIIKLWPANEVTFVGLPNGILFKIRSAGSGGQNMFAVHEEEGTVTGVPGYDYWMGTQQFRSRVTALAGVGDVTVVGLSDGRMLKVQGHGSGGQNMFAAVESENGFEGVQGYDCLLGSQRFSHGVTGIWPVGEVLFVALADGTLVKVRGTGGGGYNMLAVHEEEGTVTGVPGYDYWMGTQQC